MLGQPIKSFIESISSGSASGLDEPCPASNGVKSELVSNFGRSHGSWKILLVSKHKNHSVLEFFFWKHFVELFSCIIHSISVIAIYNEDKALSVLVIVSPERSDFVLTTYIPNCEGNVFLVDCLHIETNRWNCGHYFSQFEFVEDGGLTSSIETDH